MAKQYVYLVSVDGTAAPKFEHSTLKEAKTEAERLAGMQGMNNKTIRVLRQEAVLRVTQKLVVDKAWS
jgi:hypothetical protein